MSAFLFYSAGRNKSQIAAVTGPLPPKAITTNCHVRNLSEAKRKKLQEGLICLKVSSARFFSPYWKDLRYLLIINF